MPDDQRISFGNTNPTRSIVFAMLVGVAVSGCSGLPAFSDSDTQQNGSSAQGERVADLEAEVTALREEVARLRGDNGPPKMSPMDGEQRTQNQSPINLNAPGVTSTSSLLPAVAGPKDTASGSDLITGSVGPTAQTPGRWAGEIPVSGGPSGAALELGRPRSDSFALQLGSFAHEQNLKPARAFVLAAHGDLLTDLRFRSELISLAGKRYYNLVAGPLGTESEGAAVCREIENRGGFCKVAKFKGAPLD